MRRIFAELREPGGESTVEGISGGKGGDDIDLECWVVVGGAVPSGREEHHLSFAVQATAPGAPAA